MSKTAETVLKWTFGVPLAFIALVGLMLGLEALLSPVLDALGLP